jgi:hypothetical protein
MRILAFTLIASLALAGEGVPWNTDVAATRAAALKDGKPCALVLNAKSPAL